MRYVALLRGINVGGNSTVPMGELRIVFEALGFDAVRTYINSGNVIFTGPEGDRAALTARIEGAIEARFGFPVATLVRDIDEVRSIVGALQPQWTNDSAQRCDVFFLWDETDRPSVIDQIRWDPELEDVVYTPGALLWHLDRANVRRSKVPRIIGTPAYKLFTIRNCNTARKLLELLEA